MKTTAEHASEVWRDVARIRAQAPLVHNLTNYVVMNFTANALLSLGAAPVMAHAIEEVEEMVGMAGALVLNIGTLSALWVEAMLAAGKRAAKNGTPIVLDPVGAGATRFRTETAQRLMREAPPAIVRGNASEIRALFLSGPGARGVDSRHASEEALEAAQGLSTRFGCVVSVSGATDLIVSGSSVIKVANGRPIMPKVTGLGCAATALTGAFAAVSPSAHEAAAHAMAVMGIAGELAAERAAGPGTFQAQFLDALYLLDEDTVRRRLKMEAQ